MITEHGACTVAQGFYETQGLQRLGTAIHEVAAKPERILGIIEIYFLE